MSTSLLLKACLAWLGILVLAVLNGGLREAVLIPRLGLAAAQVTSGLLLSTLILVMTYLSLPWLGARQPWQLIAVGLLWLGLTLIFEFSFGFWQGKSLAILLENYTFKGGNILPVVLLVTGLAPYLIAKLRGWL